MSDKRVSVPQGHNGGGGLGEKGWRQQREGDRVASG